MDRYRIRKLYVPAGVASPGGVSRVSRWGYVGSQGIRAVPASRSIPSPWTRVLRTGYAHLPVEDFVFGTRQVRSVAADTEVVTFAAGALLHEESVSFTFWTAALD